MNERIKLLAKEAGASYGDAYDLYLLEEHIEKFAELIVRECCLALWTEECHTSDLAFDEVKRNSKKIKQHFGVEE